MEGKSSLPPCNSSPPPTNVPNFFPENEVPFLRCCTNQLFFFTQMICTVQSVFPPSRMREIASFLIPVTVRLYSARTICTWVWRSQTAFGGPTSPLGIIVASRLESQDNRFLAIWPWASDLASLCLRYFNCKTVIIIVPLGSPGGSGV